MILRFADNDKLTDLIHNLAKAWNCSPYDINCGQCEEFAFAVLDENDQLKVRFQDMEDVCTESFAGADNDLPGHVWIVCDGRHYDVECPGGVNNWEELPIFKKFFGKQQ